MDRDQAEQAVIDAFATLQKKTTNKQFEALASNPLLESLFDALMDLQQAAQD